MLTLSLVVRKVSLIAISPNVRRLLIKVLEVFKAFQQTAWDLFMRQPVKQVGKFSFCKIYTVFVGNLFYRLSLKKIPYAVCWKASKTSKTLILKRRTLGEPFDIAQT